MQFQISPSVFALYPSLRVGLVWARGCVNAYAGAELAKRLREAEADLQARLTEETLKSHPSIVAWQDAHKKFGSNPNKFQPSVQALAKRVVKGGQLPSINPLVDCYNIVSLRYLLPVGGEDFDRCNGDIRLTVAEGEEPFIELGSTENDPALPGEVLYRDDEAVICRKFNWREADRTKLTDRTIHAMLVLESLLPDEPLDQALSDLSKLVADHTGATCEQFVLHAGNKSAELASNRSWEDEE